MQCNNFSDNKLLHISSELILLFNLNIFENTLEGLNMLVFAYVQSKMWEVTVLVVLVILLS